VRNPVSKRPSKSKRIRIDLSPADSETWATSPAAARRLRNAATDLAYAEAGRVGEAFFEVRDSRGLVLYEGYVGDREL
jgi:hypothetical protein